MSVSLSFFAASRDGWQDAVADRVRGLSLSAQHRQRSASLCGIQDESEGTELVSRSCMMGIFSQNRRGSSLAHSDAVTSLGLHLGTAANRSLAAVLATHMLSKQGV